jgi:nucleoside-diphosphate-sugar epimerase
MLCGFVVREVVLTVNQGRGRGPAATRGRQTYELAKLVLRKGYIPIVGEGKSRWNTVHIEDLSEVFRLLVNAAVEKKSELHIWGAKGYVFTENGEHVWSDLARLFGEKAESLGLIKKGAKEYPLGKDEALEVAGFEAVSWGLNSRGKAERAREVLGWKPGQRSIEDSVEEILEDEKKRLEG